MSTVTNESNNNDEHPVDRLAAYALHALEPDEYRMVKQHLATCAKCRAEVAAYAQTVALLPYAAEPLPVPLRIRGRLLTSIDEIGSSNAERMIGLPSSTPATRAAGTRRTRPSRNTLRWLAFSAVPLIVVLAIVTIMGSIISDQQNRIETFEREQALVDSAIIGSNAVGDGAQADFITTATVAGARGKVIVNRDLGTALVLVVDMPALENDNYYVAWLHARGADEYTRAGALSMTQDGRASLNVTPASPISDYVELVITVEPRPDAEAPNGPHVMTASLPRT